MIIYGCTEYVFSFYNDITSHDNLLISPCDAKIGKIKYSPHLVGLYLILTIVTQIKLPNFEDELKSNLFVANKFV